MTFKAEVDDRTLSDADRHSKQNLKLLLKVLSFGFLGLLLILIPHIGDLFHPSFNDILIEGVLGLATIILAALGFTYQRKYVVGEKLP